MLSVCLFIIFVCLSVGVANRGAGQTRIKLIVNLVTMFRHDFSKGEEIDSCSHSIEMKMPL